MRGIFFAPWRNDCPSALVVRSFTSGRRSSAARTDVAPPVPLGGSQRRTRARHEASAHALSNLLRAGRRLLESIQGHAREMLRRRERASLLLPGGDVPWAVVGRRQVLQLRHDVPLLHRI